MTDPNRDNYNMSQKKRLQIFAIFINRIYMQKFLSCTWTRILRIYDPFNSNKKRSERMDRGLEDKTRVNRIWNNCNIIIITIYKLWSYTHVPRTENNMILTLRDDNGQYKCQVSVQLRSNYAHFHDRAKYGWVVVYFITLNTTKILLNCEAIIYYKTNQSIVIYLLR